MNSMLIIRLLTFCSTQNIKSCLGFRKSVLMSVEDSKLVLLFKFLFVTKFTLIKGHNCKQQAMLTTRLKNAIVTAFLNAKKKENVIIYSTKTTTTKRKVFHFK